MEDPTRFRPRSMDQITSVANTLNLSHRFRLISGDAVKTIPEFARENRGLRFSLLNLDFDVYEPTATALKYFFPLLVPGGIIILDEYGNKGWGESDAVDAFFAGQAVRFERFGWSAGPGAYFVKQTPGSRRPGHRSTPLRLCLAGVAWARRVLARSGLNRVAASGPARRAGQD